MRPPTPEETWLAQRLQALVAVLEAEGAFMVGLLHRAAAGREVLLALDEAVLHLRAEPSAGSGPLRLEVRPGPPSGAAPGLPGLLTRAEVLREVIDGGALLDAVVADGRLELRAPLPKLLAFHELVQAAFALAPRCPPLRALWAGFRDEWPGLATLAAPSARLDLQAPHHGLTTRAVPAGVRHGRCIEV